MKARGALRGLFGLCIFACGRTSLDWTEADGGAGASAASNHGSGGAARRASGGASNVESGGTRNLGYGGAISLESGGVTGIHGSGGVSGVADTGIVTGGIGGTSTDAGDASSPGGSGGSNGNLDAAAATGGSPGSGGSSGAEAGPMDAGRAGTQDAGAPLLPVAASADPWEWQGQQRQVRLPNGATCAARIAIAVGGRGVCFEDSGGELECSGSVFTHDYGSTFVKIGIRDVDQVSMSASAGGTDDDICAHTGTTVQCMGANIWGQMGTGTMQPTADFIAWGGLHDLVAFAYGMWNQLCVLDQQGMIYCAGGQFDTTPVAIDQQGGHTRFWVNQGGGVLADDTSILRADQSRTECNVTTLGLQCSPSLVFGTPGSVVMGGAVSTMANTSHLPFLPGPACWLESTGEAFCGLHALLPTRINKTMTLFGGRPALALATQSYTNQICAVLADGAVECAKIAIDTGTSVPGPSAPAGSAMIGCP